MIRTAALHGLFVVGLCAGFAAQADTPFTIDPLFGDHMVVQRGKPVTVHGEGRAGVTVTVRFAGASAKGQIGADSKWTVILPPVPDGAKGSIDISVSGGDTRQFKDVVAGDVFLCSGQSNMDLSVSDTAYPKRTAEEGEGKPIRLFKVARTASAQPQTWVTPEIGWALAGAKSLPSFSAACWHMAKELAAANPGAPIGLIQASWGGTSIEDWLSGDALRTLPRHREDVDRLSQYAAHPQEATQERIAATEGWAQTADPQAAGYHTTAFNDTVWPEISLPGVWERSGISSLRSFDGLMWFRRSLELNAAQTAGPATLRLGRIDERDQVWVNGQVVGATLLGSETRSYVIPKGVLKAGRNIIAIRVLDERGAGGLMGKASDVRLDLAAGASVDLSGAWRYQTGSARRTWKTPPPFVPWAAPRGISMLWNGMIAPLHGFPLKGIAWYQGETNTSEAETYGALLTLWASSWRQAFNDPTLPVVIAQLPGYGPRSAVPTDNDWAKLREAQRLMVANDPHAGLAVLIDLGVSYDIHPAHKDEVGARLGTEMLRLAYGRKVLSAPSPVKVDAAPDAIRVQFADTGGGLVAYGSHEAAAFELCDAVAKCWFVAAQVDGDSVRLPTDPNARQVRYAWQGSAPVNLYGKSGLPVVPFAINIP